MSEHPTGDPKLRYGAGREGSGDLGPDAFLEHLASRVAERVLDGLSHSAHNKGHEARLLSVERAAAYIGRTVAALQQMIASGKLPTVRSDRRVMIDIIDLDKWIERHKEPGLQ